jgi:hypothetical protein
MGRKRKQKRHQIKKVTSPTLPVQAHGKMRLFFGHHRRRTKLFLEVLVVVLGLTKLIGDRGYQGKLNDILVDSVVRNSLTTDTLYRLFGYVRDGKTNTDDFRKNLESVMNDSNLNAQRLRDYIGDGKVECFWQDADIPDQNGNIVAHGKNVTMSVQSVDANGPLKNYQFNADQRPTDLSGRKCDFKITLPGFSYGMRLYVQLQTTIECLLIAVGAALLVLNWMPSTKVE